MTTHVSPIFPQHPLYFSDGTPEALPRASNDEEKVASEYEGEIAAPISTPPPVTLPRSNSEIEMSLKPILKQIEREKKDLYLSRAFIHLTARNFLQEAKEERLKTVLKCSAIVLALGCLHPTIIGSAACLVGYRLENYNDLYSSDINTTASASILFSNMGQGISFLVQEAELAIVPSFLLFKNVYDKAMCHIRTDIYLRHISSLEREDEKAFLYGEANRDLARWGGYLPETEEIDRIMKKIEKKKKERLSNRNILCMTANRFFRHAKKSPWTTLAKTSLIGLTGLVLHPLIIGLIGCLDSYRAGNPMDLFSSDPAAMTYAVNVYSNTGHIVEYACAGMMLSAGTASVLFGSSRKEVICETIKNIYKVQLQKPQLSEKTKDFLREKRRQDLALYA